MSQNIYGENNAPCKNRQKSSIKLRHMINEKILIYSNKSAIKEENN